MTRSVCDFEELLRSPFPRRALDRLSDAVALQDRQLSASSRHKVLALLAILHRQPTELLENLEKAWRQEDSLRVASSVFMAAYRVAPTADVLAMVPEVMEGLLATYPNKVAARRVQSALLRGPAAMKAASSANPSCVERQVVLVDDKSFDGPMKVTARKLPCTGSRGDIGRAAAVATAPGVDRSRIEQTAAAWGQALAKRWRRAEQHSDFDLYVANNCVLTAWFPHPMLEHGPILGAIDPCIEQYHHARWLGATLAHRTLDQDIDSALIIAHAGATNHYLRLIIVVATILAVQQAGGLNDRVMVAGDLSRYEELLSVLGVDPAAIGSYRDGLPARVRTAQISQIGYDSMTKVWLARDYIAKRRNARGGDLKLYISRSRSGNRPMTNEPEVEAAVTAAGYRVVYLEELSVVQQMQLMEQADSIVAPHGAGLANILFCADGVRILELLPETYFVSGFYRLARTLGFHHSMYVGKADPSADPQMTRGAWRVDIESFRTALGRLEHRS